MRHRWVVASSRSAVAGTAADCLVIDAERHHRGPYTAAGTLIWHFVERFGAAAQDAAAGRLVTLLAVRPELRTRLAVPPAVERSLEFSRAGNRRSWSLAGAHALVDFVLDCLNRSPGRVSRVVFLNADQADPLDAEFLSVLLRRVDPDRLAIDLVTSSEAAPPGLAAALAARTVTCRISPEDPRCRVEAGGSDEDPIDLAADESLSAEERRHFYRQRADELEARGEPSLALGAIPFCHEQAGGDPAVLAVAARRCMHFAFYEAALDWARRACRLADQRGERPPDGVMRDLIFALLLLERYDEVEALSEDILARGDDAEACVHAAYAQAILYARLRERPRLDFERARACIETAQTYCETLPPSDTRAANLSFLLNTLALVVMREGDSEAALRLLDEAIDYLKDEAPASFAYEATILFHNRARLHLAGKREPEALDDLGRLLELEPSDSEALFDRALIHHKAGRAAEAIRDYDASLFWGPPLIEALLNRAQLLAKTGDRAGAGRDYDHLLSIDPDHLEIIVGRATWLWEVGRLPEAEAETERGLGLHPDNARLLCLRGLVALVRNRLKEAETAFTEALARDPQLADAWANRAIVKWRRDEAESALRDLDQALRLREDPTIRRNRDKVVEQLTSGAAGTAARMLLQA